MPKNIISSVRIVFASFALTLLAYAGLDAALTAETGLSACGAAANPCLLAPLTVTAPASDAHLVTLPAAPAEPAVLAES